MNSDLKSGGEFHRLFLSLQGEWKLLREYSNDSVFEGVALFDLIDDMNFSVKEDGNLNLPESVSPLHAVREWHWQLIDDASIDISYPVTVGGALYHSLKFQQTQKRWNACDLHLCSPDEYFGKYTISENNIEIIHKVTGPNKDYQFFANYTKT